MLANPGNFGSFLMNHLRGSAGLVICSQEMLTRSVKILPHWEQCLKPVDLPGGGVPSR